MILTASFYSQKLQKIEFLRTIIYLTIKIKSIFSSIGYLTNDGNLCAIKV